MSPFEYSFSMRRQVAFPYPFMTSSMSPLQAESPFHVTGPNSLTLAPLRFQGQQGCALPSLQAVLGELFRKPEMVYPPFIRGRRRSNFITMVNPEMMKRPRRRYHEVRRMFKCSHPNCNKSYGALNHLNAHIKNMNHGPRRKAKDFLKLARILPLAN